jgi:hypothetical protein
VKVFPEIIRQLYGNHLKLVHKTFFPGYAEPFLQSLCDDAAVFFFVLPLEQAGGISL